MDSLNMDMKTDQSKTPGATPTEVQQIIDVMFKYFKKETGSEEKANQYINGVADLITKNPSAKLIQLGNTVFLVLVNSPGVVEVHTMAADEQSATLAKNFVTLTNILKNMGTKQAYTYSDDSRFAAVAKRTRLPFETSKIKKDGKEYTVYTVEFK